MRPSEILAQQRHRVQAIAHSKGASRVRVFGSVSTGQDHEGSDLDLLVDLPLGTSMLAVVGLQQALSDALGMEVDVCTERELHPALKRRILAQARAID